MFKEVLTHGESFRCQVYLVSEEHPDSDEEPERLATRSYWVVGDGQVADSGEFEPGQERGFLEHQEGVIIWILQFLLRVVEAIFRP